VPICIARRESIQLKNNDAGWSSSVARWAHNPEVVGSNPTPATNARGRLSNREAAFCMPDANGFANKRGAAGAAGPASAPPLSLGRPAQGPR
jgi:hypothetical protein